jgi:hypothetical protein
MKSLGSLAKPRSERGATPKGCSHVFQNSTSSPHNPPHDMFSPQPTSSDVPINPAARRRLRPSRPTSRLPSQQHARSGSGDVSFAQSSREDSIASLQRQDSDSITNASGDTSSFRKQVALAAKEPEGASTDLVRVLRAREESSVFADAVIDQKREIPCFEAAGSPESIERPKNKCVPFPYACCCCPWVLKLSYLLNRERRLRWLHRFHLPLWPSHRS